MEYDSGSRAIIAVHPKRYINTDKAAEHLEERVYVTDPEGNPTADRLTRAEAREQKQRYLIVTNLIFHNKKHLLVQERSPLKAIDSGKIAPSAHGVAKELYLENKERLADGRTAAIINSALEINEELRHDAEPFKVRIWPGTREELFTYAERHRLNDPDTVWLVPEVYANDA